VPKSSYSSHDLQEPKKRMFRDGVLKQPAHSSGVKMSHHRSITMCHVTFWSTELVANLRSLINLIQFDVRFKGEAANRMYPDHVIIELTCVV
jgi:hypothetical protein